MMQKPKILAADNTKVALRYMETILGDIYDVTLVQTGMSVLDCLKSEIPDLILMNANMFGMDGYEVLRRIKEDKETKEIPVILMMNVKDIQSELRGLEEGAIDFISLPFDKGKDCAYCRTFRTPKTAGAFDRETKRAD